MTTLIKAAGIRALRTLLQGILGGSLLNGAVALFLGIGDPATKTALIASSATILATTLASFLQGILTGLPEAEPVVLTASVDTGIGGYDVTHVTAQVAGRIVKEAHFDLEPTRTKPKPTRKTA